MSTSHRLQEQRGLPTHSVETGYLLDLIIALKLRLHNTPAPQEMPITAHRLAEWDLVHRAHFNGCNAFNRGNVFALPEGINLDRLYNIHRDDVARIDVFIKALQQGLDEGDVKAHITDADLHAVELTLRRLEACTEKNLWT